MTGKKKLLIGVGIVVVLGAIAFANFKFKKTDGITVNTVKFHLRNVYDKLSVRNRAQAIAYYYSAQPFRNEAEAEPALTSTTIGTSLKTSTGLALNRNWESLTRPSV